MGKVQCKVLENLVIKGPEIGYFSAPGKSWYIFKEEDEEVAKQVFVDRGLTINYTRGQKYLGGFIGSVESKEEWLEEKVAIWTEAVKALTKITVKYPQTAYAGFVFCLQNEW